MAHLLFLAGSIRKESYNRKLAKYAYEYAKELGADAKLIELKDYDMPLYNGDLEEEKGVPENAKKLKKEFADCCGFFIANPEYNSSITPLLKNTLDWISRKSEKDEANLIAYTGKVAAMAAASPGALGGLRSLLVLRMMLSNIGVHVMPDQVAVPAAHNVFDEKGDIKDEKYAKMVKNLVKNFYEHTQKVKK